MNSMVFETSLNKQYPNEIEILKSIFGESIEKAGGKGHRFYHQLRVANYCMKIADLRTLDEEKKNVLILSALFHDIGKAPRITEKGTLDGSHKADEIHGNHTDKDYVFVLLKKYIGDYETPSSAKCPDCHSPNGLIYVEGCVKCKECGFSVC